MYVCAERVANGWVITRDGVRKAVLDGPDARHMVRMALNDVLVDAPT